MGEIRSASQIWREDGLAFTGLPFNKWLSKEKEEFKRHSQGNEFDQMAYIDQKYRQLEHDRLHPVIKAEGDFPEVDFSQEALYNADTNAPKVTVTREKTIVGLKPVVFYTVAGALGLTVLFIAISIIRGATRTKTVSNEV